MRTNKLGTIIHRRRVSEADRILKRTERRLTYKPDNFRLVRLPYGVDTAILSVFRALAKERP
jgi:hypothetical protein